MDSPDYETKQKHKDKNKHPHHRHSHNRHDHDIEELDDSEETSKVNPFADPELDTSETTNSSLQIVIIPKIIEHEDNSELENISYGVLDEDDEDKNQHYFSDQVHFVRPRWDGQWLNLVAMIAFAVDMSNLVSFPTEVSRQGGVVYILVYFITLILFVYPMLYLEVIVGQYFQTGMIGIWGISPIFRGLAAGIFYITFIIIAYVPINIMWASLFFWDAMASIQTGKLPWATCDNDWNSCKCEGNRIPECLALQKASNTTLFITTVDDEALYTPAAEYFIGKILKLLKTKYEDPIVIKDITENGNWSIAFGFWNDEEGLGELIPSHCLITLGIYIAILLVNLLRLKYIGYIYTFTAIFPISILFLLFCRGITLQGATAGLEKYLKPDFYKLLDVSVWYAAFQASFYSVGSGIGCHIVMASFNPLNHNVRRDAILCIIVDSLMSLLGCLVAFMFVGYVHTLQRVPLPDIFPGEISVFISFAEAFINISGSSFFAALYYFMIVIFCADTQFVTLQALSFSLYEEYKRKYPNQIVSKGIFLYTIWGFSFATTLLSTTRGGYWVFTFLTHRGFGSSSFIFMFMEIVLFAWIWGIEEVCAATVTIMGYRPGFFLRFCWKFLLPILLLTIVVYRDSIRELDPVQVFGQSAPENSERVGEAFQWAAIALMTCYATYVFIRMAFKEKRLSWLQVLMLLISPEYEHDSIRENIKNAKRLTWRHYAFFRFQGELADLHVKEHAMKWKDKMKGFGQKIKAQTESRKTVEGTGSQSGVSATSDMESARKGVKGKKKLDKKQRAEMRKEEESAWEMWEKVKPHVDLEFDDECETESSAVALPSPSQKSKSRMPVKAKTATVVNPSKMKPTKSGVTKKKAVGSSGILKASNKVTPKD